MTKPIDENRLTHPLEEHYLDMTRRRFFGNAGRSLGAGLGGFALASMMGLAGDTPAQPGGPVLIQPAGPHFTPKAKRVIYLFMAGGPSQIDLFDHKPRLAQLHKTELPASVRMGPAEIALTRIF